MKKTVLLGILGLSALTMSSHAQGILFLQNNSLSPSAPYVTYGNNVPVNGVTGTTLATPGTFVTYQAGTQFFWTAGFYWAPGTVSVPADPTGIADPSTLNPLLTLATGGVSTAMIAGPLTPGLPGAYQSARAWAAPGVAGGGTITIETIAYNNSFVSPGSYASASYRGHSDAYQVVLAAPTGAPTPTGYTSLPISVNPVPEPSILALSGIGAAALMLTRKKKQPTDN